MNAGFQKPVAAYDFSKIIIRPLTADDAETYFALRQKIFESGGGKYFSDSYERESPLNEQQRREWCTEKRDHCIMGIFDGEKLIGIMMITAQGPEDSLISEWEATWLEPEYRKFGIAHQAYEKVCEWTKAHGYQHVIVFIRDDNVRSRQIREAQGFIHIQTKHGAVWADGSIADTNLFLLDLFPDNDVNDNPYDRAIRRLEDTLASLNDEAPFIEEAIQDRIEALQNTPQERLIHYLEEALASMDVDKSDIVPDHDSAKI